MHDKRNNKLQFQNLYMGKKHIYIYIYSKTDFPHDKHVDLSWELRQ